LWLGAHSSDGVADAPLIVGTCASFTVTLNAQLSVVLASMVEVPVQVVEVVPTGYSNPEGGNARHHAQLPDTL